MTSQHILLIVDRLEFSADRMKDLLRPAESLSDQREYFAMWWARRAGHYANQLLDLAEKGECAK